MMKLFVVLDAAILSADHGFVKARYTGAVNSFVI